MCVGVACEVPLRRRTYNQAAMAVRPPSSVGMLPVKELEPKSLLGDGDGAQEARGTCERSGRIGHAVAALCVWA